ncbi:MAG: hypothetical protein EPN79_16045 [Burkholderiaceae bacterium]|nr:MAG: hypothetical protein EPN79_16045 [Burkholderiaceae bacterium]
MAVALMNEFSFDPALVKGASLLPDGAFVSVDDLAFSANNLGRKIAQTMQVSIDGRDVSVAYMDGEPTYDLVMAQDKPANLGTLAELQQRHPDVYARLQDAFGGPGHFTPLEMVTALVAVVESDAPTPAALSYKVEAMKAQVAVKRGAWVVANRFDAMSFSPIDFAASGL